MAKFGKVFQEKLQGPFGFALILLLVVLVCFAPQVEPNDWELNPAHLPEGFNIYQDGNYLYPPWALIVFWPYYFLGGVGTRILSLLLIVLVCFKNRRTVLDFLFIVLNPLFVFALLYSNPDILIFVGAILLWDTKHWFLMALALSIISVKPQGAILVIPYMLWQERDNWRNILKAAIPASLIVIPISLMGEPILFLQWLNNIQTPSEYWASMRLANDVSMTADYGILITAIILGLVFALLFYLLRKVWTRQHTLGSLFILSMLLSPYASLQSLIVGFIFIPSWKATVAIGLLSLLVAVANIWKPYEPFWLLVFWGVSLWFYKDLSSTATKIEANTETASQA